MAWFSRESEYLLLNPTNKNGGGDFEYWAGLLSKRLFTACTLEKR